MTEVIKKLPIGIESFEKIRRDGFYYVDKTGLIKELLENWGEANLFTRPRRFGKSLNMSMFQYFFEIGCDKSLFDGLEIAKDSYLCEQYMGKFPVVSISLKDIDANNYETARSMAIKVVNQEARRLQFLLDSEKLSDYDKQLFSVLLQPDMDDKSLFYSLKEITELLCKHYEKKVIVLIDEYDVPLAKANERGYYDRMIDLIRNLFGTVLKTNDYLYFAVLSGCLRVAKESIFTGLNNFNVFSITDVEFDEYFGFTDAEVKEMLQYYHLENNYETVKEWYDGYKGLMTMRQAIEISANIPHVKALSLIGVDKAIDFCEKVGITGLGDEGLSLALGGKMIILDAMNNATGAVAQYLQKIERKRVGWVLWFITNVIGIVIWYELGNAQMAVMYSVFTLNSVRGYLNWSE